MRITVSIKPEGDDPFEVDVEQTVVTMTDEQRLAAAKALCLASFKMCPAHPDEDKVAPVCVELANHMLAAVNALLRTRADRRVSDWWATQQEQQLAVAQGQIN